MGFNVACTNDNKAACIMGTSCIKDDATTAIAAGESGKCKIALEAACAFETKDACITGSKCIKTGAETEVAAAGDAGTCKVVEIAAGGACTGPDAVCVANHSCSDDDGAAVAAAATGKC